MTTMADVLREHQQSYSMLSVENPHSACTCGSETPITLPERWPHVNSDESDALRMGAHLKHQEDMLAEAGYGLLGKD